MEGDFESKGREKAGSRTKEKAALEALAELGVATNEHPGLVAGYLVVHESWDLSIRSKSKETLVVFLLFCQVAKRIVVVGVDVV